MLRKSYDEEELVNYGAVEATPVDNARESKKDKAELQAVSNTKRWLSLLALTMALVGVTLLVTFGTGNKVSWLCDELCSKGGSAKCRLLQPCYVPMMLSSKTFQRTWNSTYAFISFENLVRPFQGFCSYR
jgi:hypothetical protein